MYGWEPAWQFRLAAAHRPASDDHPRKRRRGCDATPIEGGERRRRSAGQRLNAVGAARYRATCFVFILIARRPQTR